MKRRFAWITLLAFGWCVGPRASAIPDPDPWVESFPILGLLHERCLRMKAMQRANLFETKALQDRIEAAPGMMLPEAGDIAHGLARQQKRIVDIAKTVARALREEGAAVAFPEVFEQLREDMALVRQRLLRGDAGRVTQEIQKEIVATLEEMTKALTKR